MMSINRTVLASTIALAGLLPVAQAAEDDTAAILALSELGAQLQLNQGRVVGLTLQGPEIDDNTMKSLAGLDRLQSLTLRGTSVTGGGLKPLEKLTLLGALTIHDSPVSDRDIDELAALGSVVNYDLRGTKMSNAITTSAVPMKPMTIRSRCWL